jgi:HlyD family secretion protein
VTNASLNLAARLATSVMVAETPLAHSMRRHMLAGTVAFAALFLVAGGWAATSEFAGAVIAPGTLVVDSSVKKVQHPTGGVVGEVRVRDGDHVKAGEIVVRLDETVTRANLAIVVKGLDELLARLARLEAERDGAESPVFPEELTTRASLPDVQKLLRGEAGLFQLRANARAGQKAQLTERISQLKEEMEGLGNQIEAKGQEIDLIVDELTGVRKLYKQNLIPLQRVNQLERESARLRGERGQLIASTAQAKGKISETQLQILQVDQDLRSDVAKEMREAQGKIAELVERKVAAEDQLKRIDLRAPQDGIVHQLAVHTVGGVINPAEPVMMIVPDADRLIVEAKIAPQDIDNVRQGQDAHIRLAAFNQRTTPEVAGSVDRVSPDLTSDQRTGQSYYTARIVIGPEARDVLKDLRLVPGMPAEAFIQTSSRTVLSYLIKPLSDQVRKAFREK